MQALDKPVSPTLPAQMATLKQKQTMSPGQKQMVADPTREQQLSAEEPFDVDDIVLKNINDCDKYVNAIFGPLCSIYNSNNSNLVMGSIFNNPYSIQLDTKILLDEKDINNMYKDVSKDDKEQLKIILKDCFGISDATKFPVVVEYFDVVQFPILMSNNKKLSGPCLNCLSVLSDKVSKVQDKRLKYSRNIGYGTFGAGTVSSMVAVASFFLVPIPFLQVVSLAIMGSLTCYMTATRGKNMYDGVKNKTRSKNIKNIFDKKGMVIKSFHGKIKKYFKSQMSESNKANTPEQQLSNSNIKDQAKEKNAIDKDKLKDVFSKVGNLQKQPVGKGNNENKGSGKNDNNNFKKDVENKFPLDINDDSGKKDNATKVDENVNEVDDKEEGDFIPVLGKGSEQNAKNFDKVDINNSFLNKNSIDGRNIFDKDSNNKDLNSRNIEKDKTNSNNDGYNKTSDNISNTNVDELYEKKIENKQNKSSSQSLENLEKKKKKQ